MNCVLCTPNNENILWSNDKLRVIRVDDPNFPGYFRVIWNHHVAEMSDLSEEDRCYLEKVLLTVERSVRSGMKPDKINWAQFGNMVPHLHWHIIARYRDDSHFPESIWGIKKRDAQLSRLNKWKDLADQTSVLIQKSLAEI